MTYRSQIPTRHGKTLDWVLRDFNYRKWANKDSESQLVWITGDPECGKTVLSKFLLENLEETSTETTDEYATIAGSFILLF